MTVHLHRLALRRRRTPQGVRGLKCVVRHPCPCCVRRTPQGVRGLKSLCPEQEEDNDDVAPRKGCVD